MRPSAVRWHAGLVVAALAVGVPAAADPVHGRILGQATGSHSSRDSLAASLLSENRQDLNGSLRLAWAPRHGAWRFDVAYQIDVAGGDQPLLNSRLADLGILPKPPPTTAWDGSDTFVDEQRFSAEQKVDRLSIGYAGTHLIVRAGRQALTWGSGLVFHPMDLFDPFSPAATDMEFKPGTDMLYAQYLFDDGSDVQFVAVPRPARRGGSLTRDASSAALLLRRRVGPVQTSWMLARDHDDTVAALAVTATLGGASWSAEIVPTFINGGGRSVSALLNVSNAGTLWGRDVRYFVELYRNGFGLTDEPYTLSDLPPDLIDRQLRGQVFSTGRDHVAAGAEIQVTPLFEISPTVIVSLNDNSALALVQADYSLSDNLALIVGAQVPVGASGTQFGGIGLDADAPPYLEPPARLYLQIRRYF